MTEDNHLETVAEIVSAYVSNNSVVRTSLPDLIASISQSLRGLATPAAPEPVELTPAVNPKKSVHADHITCLEDGKRFKSIKRHLRTTHGMSPDEYRAKWGLARDYPMVAPAYAEERSTLAKKMGLGRKPGFKAKRRAK